MSSAKDFIVKLAAQRLERKRKSAAGDNGVDDDLPALCDDAKLLLTQIAIELDGLRRSGAAEKLPPRVDDGAAWPSSATTQPTVVSDEEQLCLQARRLLKWAQTLTSDGARQSLSVPGVSKPLEPADTECCTVVGAIAIVRGTTSAPNVSTEDYTSQPWLRTSAEELATEFGGSMVAAEKEGRALGWLSDVARMVATAHAKEYKEKNPALDQLTPARPSQPPAKASAPGEAKPTSKPFVDDDNVISTSTVPVLPRPHDRPASTPGHNAGSGHPVAGSTATMAAPKGVPVVVEASALHDAVLGFRVVTPTSTKSKATDHDPQAPPIEISSGHDSLPPPSEAKRPRPTPLDASSLQSTHVHPATSAPVAQPQQTSMRTGLPHGASAVADDGARHVPNRAHPPPPRATADEQHPTPLGGRGDAPRHNQMFSSAVALLISELASVFRHNRIDAMDLVDIRGAFSERNEGGLQGLVWKTTAKARLLQAVLPPSALGDAIREAQALGWLVPLTHERSGGAPLYEIKRSAETAAIRFLDRRTVLTSVLHEHDEAQGRQRRNLYPSAPENDIISSLARVGGRRKGLFSTRSVVEKFIEHMVQIDFIGRRVNSSHVTELVGNFGPPHARRAPGLPPPPSADYAATPAGGEVTSGSVAQAQGTQQEYGSATVLAPLLTDASPVDSGPPSGPVVDDATRTRSGIGAAAGGASGASPQQHANAGGIYDYAPLPSYQQHQQQSQPVASLPPEYHQVVAQQQQHLASPPGYHQAMHHHQLQPVPSSPEYHASPPYTFDATASSHPTAGRDTNSTPRAAAVDHAGAVGGGGGSQRASRLMQLLRGLNPSQPFSTNAHGLLSVEGDTVAADLGLDAAGRLHLSVYLRALRSNVTAPRQLIPMYDVNPAEAGSALLGSLLACPVPARDCSLERFHGRRTRCITDLLPDVAAVWNIATRCAFVLKVVPDGSNGDDQFVTIVTDLEGCPLAVSDVCESPAASFSAVCVAAPNVCGEAVTPYVVGASALANTNPRALTQVAETSETSKKQNEIIRRILEPALSLRAWIAACHALKRARDPKKLLGFLCTVWALARGFGRDAKV